jgi:4-amino-4-deoxychorismate lyase
MNHARKTLFNTSGEIDLEKVLQQAMAQHASDLSAGLFKCRVVYDRQIKKIEFLPYVMPRINSLQPVACNSMDYSFKYEDRSRLQQLYALRGAAADILIIKNGLITDTSFCNVVFYNGKQWLTPERPLLRGVRRAALLEQEQILTAVIRWDDLQYFTKVRLVNAMIRFEDRLEFPVKWISKTLKPCPI